MSDVAFLKYDVNQSHQYIKFKPSFAKYLFFGYCHLGGKVCRTDHKFKDIKLYISNLTTIFNRYVGIFIAVHSACHAGAKQDNLKSCL